MSDIKRAEYLKGYADRRAKIIVMLRKQSIPAVAHALGISRQRVWKIADDHIRKIKRKSTTGAKP